MVRVRKGVLATHLDNLRLRGLAPETESRYMNVAQDYLDFSGGEFSRDAVIDFLNEYKGMSTTYQRLIMYGVKTLFESVGTEWPLTKRETPKVSKAKRPFFTFEQAQQLLKVAKSNPLDYALLRVSAVTGARRRELAEAKLADYNRPYLKIGGAKGSEARVRGLDSDTCNAIDAYLPLRRPQSGIYLFTGSTERLNVSTLSHRFRDLLKKAGVETGSEYEKGFGLHAMRRGVVTWLFQAGMREKEIQEALGWKSAYMPHQYIQLTAGEVEERVKSTHPMFEGER